MIQIENIRKTYVTGDLTQKALDDVSLSLRDSEFVAILGPSGSGKTTLLNVIGGLDRYDSGDLIINGTSTKKYKDRDWDSYRNHSIGFVFQAYNLIPHQTLLSNVELALTISGISKSERKERALHALDEVGLKEQAYKKPNQLSGGQMQRVAIARALVNNPDILLADEPTGALDSQTSIQVMDLLKKVAKDRLVVMVTHNPELAEQYATRIVRLRDGKIVDDSKPYNPIKSDENDNKNFGKAKMNFLTALSLSFNNLLTKKGRTILVSFAGSIGIIGIALILSMSQGFQNYIDKIQEDTLTSYPLQITKETANVSSVVLSMSGQDGTKKVKKKKAKKGEVVEQQYMTSFAESIGINDLKSFKKHLENKSKEVGRDVTRIDYSYSVEPCIYTIDATNTLTQINPKKSTTNTMYSYSAMANMGMDMGGTFFEVPNDKKVLKDHYKILAGRFPQKYNEVILTLQKKDEISDLLVYSLGLRDSKELSSVMKDVMAGKKPNISNKAKTFTYKQLMNLKLKLVNPSDMYKYNSQYNVYEDMSNDKDYSQRVFDNAQDLNIVGVAVSKDEKSLMNRSGIAYTKELTDYVIDVASKSEIVKKQRENEEINILTNKKFDDESETSKGPNLQNMIGIDNQALVSAFNMEGLAGINIDEKQTEQIVMSAARECANILVNGINPTDLSGAFIGINSSVLLTAVSNYEDNNVSGGRLSLAGVDAEKAKITKEKYKNMLETIISSDPAFAKMSILTQLLSDDDYDKLADIVKTMFDGYYSELKTGNYGYDDLTQTIAYNKMTNLVIYGETGIQITSLQLVGKANQISSVLSKTAEIVNSVMQVYATAIVGQSIGQATSKIISPIMSGMSKMTGLKVDEKKIAQAFKFNMTEEALQRLMETMMSSNDRASFETNLSNLGYQDKTNPSAISFYFKSFTNKDRFLKFIDKYNKIVKKKQKIEYTDTTGLLMSSVQTIVDSVSYVLIAFVSVSLIVSSIMIAVITLISVMERRKEIGILRAMGASKRNVSNIFNAETFIIGLLSGLTGILVSLFFLLPINGIIHLVNQDITAILPFKYAVILVLISVGLTMIAGFIPSKKASKSDPVEALRAE